MIFFKNAFFTIFHPINSYFLQIEQSKHVRNFTFIHVAHGWLNSYRFCSENLGSCVEEILTWYVRATLSSQDFPLHFRKLSPKTIFKKGSTFHSKSCYTKHFEKFGQLMGIFLEGSFKDFLQGDSNVTF